MAAASEDEEANYWPGFVDALSTMTMILIFLMMILSLVLVSISQNTSKSQIKAIAKAAKVDISSSAMSNDQLTSHILESLARVTDPPKTIGSVTDVKPKQEPIVVQPNVQPEMANAQNLLVEEGQKVTSQGQQDQVISNDRSATDGVQSNIGASTAPSDNPPNSSQTAELDPSAGKYHYAAPQNHLDEKRIVSRRSADLRSFGGGSDVKLNKALVTIEFQTNAVKVDEASGKKLSSFIQERKTALQGRKIQVRALANVHNGNVSEMRRFSYYRAMGIRQFLIESGIAASQIDVGIEDISNTEPADIVELFEI